MQGSFYTVINILLLVYACYSWYWQARLEVKGKFRISAVIWTLIVIWLGFSWNYIARGDSGLSLFLALILLVSLVDGRTGFAPKRAVVSGYFKRTVKYAEIDNVLLINIPIGKKPTVICILATNTGRQYNLQLKADVNEIINYLRQNSDHNIKVEIRNTL